MGKKNAANSQNGREANVWIAVIDGWMRDSKIRRDALLGLAMVTAAICLLLAQISGTLVPIMHNSIAQIAAGSISALGGGWAGVRYARRKLAARQAVVLPPTSRATEPPQDDAPQ